MPVILQTLMVLQDTKARPIHITPQVQTQLSGQH
jgi:hypothetical protein